MTGALFNALGIVAGGLAGATVLRGRRLPASTEAFFKLAVGVFTIFFGLRLVWLSLDGSFSRVCKQVVIAALAIMLGKLLGRLLHLQKMSNRSGQYALRLMQQAQPGHPGRFTDGLVACSILFCAAPLGILGAVQDGLSHYFYPQAVKAVMDGLATAGFVAMFGWGALVSALPVFLLQALISRGCNQLVPFLTEHGLVDSVNFAGGLLVCTVGLVIFDFKKVELADYLPTLALAPLITWFWK